MQQGAYNDLQVLVNTELLSTSSSMAFLLESIISVEIA